MPSLNQKKKVLLIKLRYIGDTLSLLPVVENLYAKRPEIEVDVMVHKGTEELLLYHPGIRKIWIYDRDEAKKNILKSISYHIQFIKNLRFEKYDTIIDYTHGDRAAFLAFMIHAPRRVTYRDSSSLSKLLMNEIINLNPKQLHIVDYQLEALKRIGLEQLSKRMKIYLPEFLGPHLEKRIPGLKQRNGLRVVIHPGAGKKFRQWRPQRFGSIARRLRDQYGAEIILLSGPYETQLMQEVEQSMGFASFFKSSRLTLLEMAGVLKNSDLLIANDSAPGHIAAGVDCSSLILFGPTFPHMWRPYSPKNEVIFKNVPCCGCRQIVCIRPENNCMDLIEVDEVWEKAKTLLKAF